MANETGGAGLPADAGNSHTRRTVWVITLGLVTGVIGLLALAPTMAGRAQQVAREQGNAGLAQFLETRSDLFKQDKPYRDSNSTNANAAH